ncbi:MAG: CotH kinase family protein [Arcicella sp.]|nr:CotH kinase family protein [Arcicella sp.]
MKTYFTVILSLLLQVSFSQTFTDSNLPIVVINTDGSVPISTNLSETPANMGIVSNSTGRNYLTNPFNNYNGRITTRVRGNSSTNFPKKSYKVTLKTAAGGDTSATILGMPEEEDWVLYASYNDKSLMRDPLVYYLANQVGQYASRTRFCELVVNGEYLGVYAMEEQVKRGSSRVNISKMNSTDISGNSLTGGYLLKIDSQGGSVGYFWNISRNSICTDPSGSASGHGNTIEIEYPKSSNLQIAQRNYIQQYVTDFETALHNNDFSTTTGYRKYVNLNSFIDHFLMTEFVKNPDGYRLSTYFHKDRDSKGGKLTMGPLWDYNFAVGNSPTPACNGQNPAGWAYQDNFTCDPVNWAKPMPFWWNELMKDPNFVNGVKDRWLVLRQGALSLPVINNFIDSTATLLAESQARNFTKWDILNINNGILLYNGGTYASEIDSLKLWINHRLTWIDNNVDGLGHYIHTQGTTQLCTSTPVLLAGLSGRANQYNWIRNGVNGQANTKNYLAPNASTYELKTTLTGQRNCVITLLPKTLINNSLGINTTVRSGNWSNSQTWSCGRLPLVTDEVIIESGHAVSINNSNTIRLLTMKINSHLAYLSNFVLLQISP